MLLLVTLFFFARTLHGHPTPSDILQTTVQNAHSVMSRLRRETGGDFNLPNPETGLCECPDMRTLRGIIWSCATTLILSAWVAVHFNVQPHSLSPFRRAMIRFGTLSAAILGPELALYWAYKEWSSSREIDKWFKDKCASFSVVTLACFLMCGRFALDENTFVLPSDGRIRVLRIKRRSDYMDGDPSAYLQRAIGERTHRNADYHRRRDQRQKQR